jgi:hypothetical protein
MLMMHSAYKLARRRQTRQQTPVSAASASSPNVLGSGTGFGPPAAVTDVAVA